MTTLRIARPAIRITAARAARRPAPPRFTDCMEDALTAIVLLAAALFAAGLLRYGAPAGAARAAGLAVLETGALAAATGCLIALGKGIVSRA